MQFSCAFEKKVRALGDCFALGQLFSTATMMKESSCELFLLYLHFATSLFFFSIFLLFCSDHISVGVCLYAIECVSRKRSDHQTASCISSDCFLFERQTEQTIRKQI